MKYALDVFERLAIKLEHDAVGLGYTQAWHKGPRDTSPYAVYNEFICAEIGQFLRLPIPPHAITYWASDDDEHPLFSSLDFNFSRASLPPIIPEFLFRHLPHLAAGVLAFDILIANGDRHDNNLLVDNLQRPRNVHVWDHEQALLGGFDLLGLQRLDELRVRLGITGSNISGGTAHCLLPYISTCKHLYDWADRIRQIPPWFVDEICEETQKYGLSAELATASALFLRQRVVKIRQLIDEHRPAFPMITDWPKQGELPI